MQRSDNHEPLTDDNYPRQPAKMIVVTPDILLDAVQKALGLTVPQSLLLRADEVIQ